MTGVKYAGTFSDHSGYGQANRSFITALYLAGVNVTTELIIQVPERATFGWSGELAKALEEQKIDYKIKIIHLTPDMYPRYMESGKYHIGHLFYETDKLPKEWVVPCNGMNEIWTASEYQADMMRASGVTVPIYCFPQPIDILPATSKTEAYATPGFDGFKFYSIFQWIDRKNPRALITNYWKTFEHTKDVALIIKTYGVNYSDDEFLRIKAEISQWKAETPQVTYPKLLLVRKLMSTEQMFKLHATGDCYINTSRGEGWCIPAVEASLMGNPVISIDHTGFADYLDQDSYYPCDSTSTRVMEHPSIKFYKSDQNWLEINPETLVKKMVEVYNDKGKAKSVGAKAQEFVIDNFTYQKVGEAMKKRLQEIEKSL